MRGMSSRGGGSGGTSRGSRRGPGEVSLERALSKLGLATRSVARALIQEGRVTVDGRMVTEPLAPVVPERILLTIDGSPQRRPPPLTVLLHKPPGVVTTRSDPEGRPTVYGCLGGRAGGGATPGEPRAAAVRSLAGAHLVPVGRLDAATTGLLLLTNDTRFADWVTDPIHAVPRVYRVTVRGELSADGAGQLTAGIEDRGDRLAARAVRVRRRFRHETHLVLELTEGKNREVRRLLAALGHEVTALERISFGGLHLGDLAPGAWREVPLAELQAAFPEAPLRHPAQG